MFTKAAFLAALVAGASAVAPAAYGEQPKGYESNSSSSSAASSPDQPTTYAAPPTYGDKSSSSTTPSSPATPTTYSVPAEYPSSSSSSSSYSPVQPSSTPYSPVQHSSSSSSIPYSSVQPSSTPYSPVQPSTSSCESQSSYPTESKSYGPSTTGGAYSPVYSQASSSWSSSAPYQPSAVYPSSSSKSHDDYTTATITATKFLTVTGGQGEYVTTTESVYTTYCPKSEVSKITKSQEKPSETKPAVPAKSSSSSTLYSPEKPSTNSVPSYPQKTSSKPSAPLSTGVSTVSKPAPSGYSMSEVVYDKTLTYTLGHGASTTVITTNVKSTSTLYLTKTVYQTKSEGQPTGSATVPAYPTKSESKSTPYSPQQPSTYESMSKGQTTVKTTSTITNFVTVYPSPTSSVENSPVGSGEAPKYDCVPQTVTVTQKETVYVTAPSETSYKTEGPKQSNTVPYYPTKSSIAPVSSGMPHSTGFATSYVKPSAPAYKPSSKSESSPEKPTMSYGTGYPVPTSSSTESKPEYPQTSSTAYSPEMPSTHESYPVPTYPASMSSSTESKIQYPTTSSIPYSPAKPSTSVEKPAAYPAVSTAYVSPLPSTPASPEKPAGYAPKGY